ncbi:MAG: CHAT domain-containing protein [Desulfobulbaceae bacterium]|nr:CHAT domain-containing protein [Desulfobulbaceae bacterium]
MTDSNTKVDLLIKGINLDVSQDDVLITGNGADILQATPRTGAAIQLGLDRSEESDSLTLTDKDDVVELALEDNLVLYTSVQRLREEIIPATQRGGESGEVTLPTRLSFTNQRTRGEDGLLIKSVKVLDIKGKLLNAAAKKGGGLAARKIAEKIEEQLVGPDILYRLAAGSTQDKDTIELQPATLREVDTSNPVLLFIHGTASSTYGSFSELWDPSSNTGDTVWQDLQEKYKKNIFALEHRTLTNSPIDNIVDLMEKLPACCRLHLVSHSRGGLAGELLCRGQFNNSREPFTEKDIALFDTKKVSGFTGLLAETQKDYQHHQQQLEKLNTLLLEKQPVIERFIRVACPARGTTLASGKLDVYLSGILNVIGLIPALKLSPIYGLLKAFTLAVAKERTRPEQLPGLEAQMPGSPFIAMLNSAPESVKAHLAVIKGDIEPTGILKKISMFFLDRFYESDHDLVVNTPSMDGGARRENRIPVLFDQGSDINHFRYFENSKTRQGLFYGLTDKALPPKGFKLEEQKAVEIARTLPRGKQHDEVPSVFVLPGITGSHLGLDGDRIWIDFSGLVRGRFGDLHITAENIEPQAPVAKAYGDLIDHLAQTHYVIPFGYDWRRSVLESGRDLGAAVDERLRNSEQPVRIVAHSMGGLVTRGMMSECKEVWERMRAREGSRILMLGTPNRGSHSIARIFARQDRLIKMLALADLRHDQNELLDIIRRFPGVLELLPVDEHGKIDIDNSIWDDFGTALPGDWKRPTKTDLNKSQKTWDKLSKVDLDPDFVLYVAGRADETPVSVAVKETGAKEKEIHFFATEKGDGQVPWATGIPEGIKHWFVNAVHGDIPDHRPAYKAFVEILETGSTMLLATQPPVARGLAGDKVMLPDGVDIFPGEEQLLAAGLGKNIKGKVSQKPEIPPVHVSVVHGNLCFARSPLVVGHYQGDTIVSAEAVLDELLDHRLTQRQQKGVYPGPLMTNDILFNVSANQFPGIVIVGLGEVGELTSGTLTSTFRDAVIRYALIGRETNQFAGKPIELSTLLIGTGAGKLSISDSVSSLMRGVVQANKVLAGPTSNLDLVVSKLEFIELHEDVAIAAQYALLNSATNIEFGDTFVREETIVQRNGGRTRAYFSEDQDWWQRLRIEVTKDGGLKYTTLGVRARAEMRIQAIQRQSIEPFLKELTTQTLASDNAGRVLFELLIPPELKSHAAENQRLMLVIDKGAASYPWELLEYSGREGNEALAIKAGMIRQLATSNIIPTDICTDLNGLVVGDPFSGKASLFPDLPGAREEARMVTKVLESNRVQVEEPLIQETGAKILTKLMTGKYGVLHLAGHGVVDFELPKTVYDDEHVDSKTKKINRITGMLIGENQFLTPVEIHQMPHTPAFVFINCCHLGKITGVRPPYLERRYHLAANLATQFIEQGVKAVIAAGWAVDDGAALTFARNFYEIFFNGACFGDAVQKARATTQKMHPTVNTWGAYQCYGDPDYRITESRSTKKTTNTKSFVSLAEYLVAVKNIAEDAKTATRSSAPTLSDRLQDVIRILPSQFAKDAELLGYIGDAWGELDHFAEAIKAYSSALGAQKAHAPIRCAEQQANFKCRRAIEMARAGDMAKAKALTAEAIDLLVSLNKRFGESVERLALLGSSYKRCAEIDVTNRVSLHQNLQEMRVNYMKAYEQSLTLNGKVYSYPLINCLTARWLLHKESVNGDDLSDFDVLLDNARQANMVPEINHEHFWEAIAVTDCDLLAALKTNTFTSDKTEKLAEAYEQIGLVASSPRQMRSVVEHVDFLYAVTEQLQLPQAKHLDGLRNRLRRLF